MIDRRLIWTLTYLLCIALLIWPAIYNGYPILYSDTATYVASGMRLDTPVDRPISYGLFIRIASIGGFTLWTTVASQAAIMVVLIHLLLQRVVGPIRRPRRVLLATVALLAVFTSLPWVVSQIMADIFTPILVLSAIVLILPGLQPSRIGLFSLYFLFFLGVAAHLSHLLFALVALLVMLLLSLLGSRTGWFAVPKRPILIMLALTVLTFPIMSSAMAKSRNIFFMGAMVEHGIAKAYLDEHCGAEVYKLCAWRHRLPAKSFEFVWDPHGPIGGYDGWREAREELGAIIHGSLTEPKFIQLHILASLRATVQQLQQFDIGDGWGPFRDGSNVHYILDRHMHVDMPAMEASRQHAEEMNIVPEFITLNTWMLFLSLVLILPLLFLVARKGGYTLLMVALVVIASILLNAWVSGTFSGAIDRLGCKMIWMVPFLALLAALKLWLNKGRMKWWINSFGEAN